MTTRGARYQAMQNGEAHYVSGKPCAKGHTSERITTTGTCLACRRENEKARYHADPEKTKARVKKKYEANVEKILAKRKEYYIENIDKERKQSKLRSRVWRKENPGHRNALKAAYKADKIRATPKWANLERIKALYQLASMLNKNTDEKWHVDHIVPLRHELVCGLHTYENLRVVTAEENMKKHNHYEVV